MNTFLPKLKTTDKEFFLARDLNLNLVDYQSNEKGGYFVNLIFRHSLVSITTKPTRFKKNCNAHRLHHHLY